jgi:chaperone LolA
MNKPMFERAIRSATVLAGLWFASAAQAQTPLDSYLEHLKTLRAEFSQVVTDGKGREVQNARGKLVIVRPG